MINGAKYPLLRVFASWPGVPLVNRLLSKKDKSGKMRILDPDPHPFAFLDVEYFEQIGKDLDLNFFKGRYAQEHVLHMG
jgi:hypothetical protein